MRQYKTRKLIVGIVKKIDGRNLIRMIGKKCLSGLRGRLGVFHSIFRHGLFRYIDPS